MTLLTFPILHRREAGLALEKIVEGWWVGEVEAVGNLIGQEGAGMQQHLGTEHDGMVDPVQGTVTAGTADDG